MNNKLIIGIAAVVIVAGAAVFILSKGSSQQTQQTAPSVQMQTSPATAAPSVPAVTGNAVQITNFNFSPATLMVKVGDKVTWTNQDAVGHSATADDNSFDTGVLPTGQSGSIVFSKAGTYTYHCKVHPGMKGTIVVQ